jgi:hypothetical protein
VQRRLAVTAREAKKISLLQMLGTMVSRGRIICHRKNGISHPAFEIRIVTELLVQFGVVLEHRGHDPLQRLIVLDFRVLFVRILPCVLIRFVGRHLGRNFFCHKLSDAVAIRPCDPTKLIIERF